MISLLVPTRGRPGNMERLVHSVLTTAAVADQVEVVFYIDDDDDASTSAFATLLGRTHLGSPWPIYAVVGPRCVLSDTWNRCAQAARGDILGHMGDDLIFRSCGWDTELIRAFDRYPDRVAFVHGRDGYWDAQFGTHGWVHRTWSDTVGYFCPPYFSSDWNDTWFNDVANALGRRVYVEAIFTEHMHPAFGKALWDQTHRERLERHRLDDCDALYHSLEMMTRRVEDAAKLKALMR